MLEAFENFSPGRKREYVEWITEAKREETRARRLETALEWLAEESQETGNSRVVESSSCLRK